MRILVWLSVVACGWAQAKFDVASVKPNRTMDGGMFINRVPGGSFNATNVSLQMLVTFAYDIRPHQLSGASGWMQTDRWDIVARPSAEDAALEPASNKYSDEALERLRQRVQALLADRFQLVVRTETKEMPILALVVAKGGPHLKPSDANSAGPMMRGEIGHMTCSKVSMKLFAERTLGQRMGRSVIDKTGLAGDFDFELKYAEDRGAAAAATDTSGPDFVTAMQEQLGLKLESQKGPVQIVTIERAEKATAN